MQTSRIVGIFLFCFFIFSTLNYAIVEHYSRAIWYCNIVILIASISLIYNNARYQQIILFQSIILQTAWLVDMASYVLTQNSFFGFVTPIFSGFYEVSTFVAWLGHFLTIPVLYYFGTKESFKPSWAQIAVSTAITFIALTFLAYVVPSPYSNINCAFKPCLPYLPHFENPLLYSFVFMLEVIGSVTLLGLLLRTVWRKLQHRVVKGIILGVFVLLFLSTIFTWVYEPHYDYMTDGFTGEFMTYSDGQMTFDMIEQTECVDVTSSIETVRYDPKTDGVLSIHIEPQEVVTLVGTPCSGEFNATPKD